MRSRRVPSSTSCSTSCGRSSPSSSRDRTRRRTSSRCSRATGGSSRSCRSALDAYVWADTAPARGSSTSSGPYKKWGGDNADAYYQYAPIDPRRTYRVRGDGGRRRVLLAHRLRRARRRPLLRAHRRHGERPRWSTSTPDGDVRDRARARTRTRRRRGCGSSPTRSCAITRDYLVDPVHGRRVEWYIECRRPAGDVPAHRRRPGPPLPRRAHVGQGAGGDGAPRASASPTRSTSPTRCRSETFGWAAGDAAYAMGSFELARRRGARHPRAAHPSARSGTCACGTRSCTPTTTTTSG